MNRIDRCDDRAGFKFVAEHRITGQGEQHRGRIGEPCRFQYRAAERGQRFLRAPGVKLAQRFDEVAAHAATGAAALRTRTSIASPPSIRSARWWSIATAPISLIRIALSASERSRSNRLSRVVFPLPRNPVSPCRESLPVTAQLRPALRPADRVGGRTGSPPCARD